MTVATQSAGGLSRARFVPEILAPSEPYVFMPMPLALDIRDSPLAVGIYLLVARAFLVQQGPVPLSTADIDAFDGRDDLSRGAILRAIDRLVAGSWLIVQHQPGKKAAYLPGWGLVADLPCPWVIGEPSLARPRSMRAHRVPRAVLDVCLGRIIPHQRHAAVIERYVTTPALSLRDVGAYALAWAGVGSPTPALMRLGLAGSDGPLPPPTWEVLLARISQQPLLDADPAAPSLSLRGMQRVGLASRDPQPPDEGSPLFFVPPDMIGHMIGLPHGRMIDHLSGHMIESSVTPQTSSAASESSESAPRLDPTPAAGSSGNSGTIANEATPSTQPAQSKRSDHAPESQEQAQHCPDNNGSDIATTIPPPPQISVLLSGVPNQIEQELRALGFYPSVARRYADISLEVVEYAQAVVRRLPWARSRVSAMTWLLDQERTAPGWLEATWPNSLPSPEPEWTDDEEDTEARVGPEVFDALPAATGEMGLSIAPLAQPSPPLSMVEASQPSLVRSPDLRSDDPPAWADPVIWLQAHPVAKAALRGAHWEDGEIVGSGPQVTKLLRTRFADLVARLRCHTSVDETIGG